jgi:hypothetical protein
MGTKLFKTGSFEAELAKGMEERLLANQVEKKHSFDKLSKTADFLHAAAEIFDDTGFHAEAETLTRMLEKLAGNHPAHELPEGDWMPEEVKFFDTLAPHHQERLSKLDKKQVRDELRKIRLQNMISEELGQGTDEIPITIEMTSLKADDKKKEHNKAFTRHREYHGYYIELTPVDGKWKAAVSSDGGWGTTVHGSSFDEALQNAKHAIDGNDANDLAGKKKV